MKEGIKTTEKRAMNTVFQTPWNENTSDAPGFSAGIRECAGRVWNPCSRALSAPSVVPVIFFMPSFHPFSKLLTKVYEKEMSELYSLPVCTVKE